MTIPLSPKIQDSLSNCLGRRPGQLNVPESHFLVATHLEYAGHCHNEQRGQEHTPKCQQYHDYLPEVGARRDVSVPDC